MTTPVEPETLSLREIFGWRFWVNYGIGLVVTLWIPLARLQPMLDGKPAGTPTYLPMYKVYAQLVEHPDVAAPWGFVAAHLGITFAAMALVWWLVLRRAPVETPSERPEA